MSAVDREERLPLDVLRGYPAHDHTLDGLLRSRCAVRAHQPMLLEGEHVLSWKAFATQADALAAALQGRGIGHGERVAIVARNGSGHVLLLFALARLGAVMVPLNPELGVRELRYALTHADVSAVVTEAALLGTLRQALEGHARQPWLALVEPTPQGNLPDLSALMVGAVGTTLPAPPTADAPCVMIFTSGTTGFPKGVMHSQRNLLLVGEANMARMRLQPEDRLLIVLPFFHINALFYSLGGMLASGCALVVVEKFSASRFWHTVADTGTTAVNIIEAMGTILKSRDRAEYRPDHRLRVVYGVRQNAQAAFREDFGVPHLLTGFGMTEIPGVTCNPYGEPAKPASMGVLAQHPDPQQAWAECRIVDDEGRDLGPDEVGELWVRTPVAMLGYFRDPEQTAAAFHGGWLKTGDMVRRDADGWFFYASRKKDIIRRRGENIAGAELDMTIGAHPAVYETAAIAVPSELGEDEILAAVVLKPGEQLDARAVADWCRERLAPHKVPRYVAFVETLPHTPTHKIAKAQMRQDAALLAGATDLAAGR
ncbi:AMP-binding protein [Hydrogenophaga sp. BPS33]|uniref:AMP-binding protein n=1 Tax=Hydrogenophaga sp. BPS33 TaxID=2651974 RepID=UPI00132027E0|nr:AMP-binding protein [Hydrogenophaga sp. BPS33]QHE88260.1 ATP-dependent acyl-CoA ligase [Hydrogenophaga sp. BPS33]